MSPKRNRLHVAAAALTGVLTACSQIAPISIPRSASQNLDDKSPLTTRSVNIEATAAPAAATPVAVTSARATAPARPTPTRAPAPIAPKINSSQLVAVRRGSISEALHVGGRVSAVQEAPIAFSIRGTVATVSVDAGATVTPGQELVSLDTKDAVRQLTDVQAEIQITQARRQQFEATVSAETRARQLEQQQQLVHDQLVQQRSTDAQRQAYDQLRKAQDNFARVGAGASSADRVAAQQAVVAAQGGLDKAQSILAQLTAGPSPAEQRAAEQRVAEALLAAKKAEAQRDALMQPPDPSLVAAARKEIADAQAAVEHARNPDSAGKAVGNTGPGLSEAERQALRQSAQYALTVANQRLDTLLKGPDRAIVELASLTVENARTDLASAQLHLQELRTGATRDELGAAGNAVEVAKLALEDARLQLAEVNGHPTDQELADAQHQVDAAQATLDKSLLPALDDNPDAATGAHAAAVSPAGSGSSGLVDQLTLQHTLDQQQAQLRTLQDQVNASVIVAPYAGVVESIQVRPGDNVDARRTVLILASAGVPVVVADVSDTDTARLAVGNAASIQLDGSGAPLPGVLTVLNPGSTGTGRQAVVQLDWADGAPALGAYVQVSIAVGKRDGVLLVPQRAIKRLGDRRSVEVLDGAEAKTVEVTVGTTSSEDAEVLSGVLEGQLIVLPY